MIKFMNYTSVSFSFVKTKYLLIKPKKLMCTDERISTSKPHIRVGENGKWARGGAWEKQKKPEFTIRFDTNQVTCSIKGRNFMEQDCH